MPTVPVFVPPSQYEDLTPEHKVIVNRIRDHKRLAEDFTRQWRDRCNLIYGLYRNYRRQRTALQQERDRDTRGTILHDMRRTWGEELFIPQSFAIVETIVPRALSNDPKMRCLPAHPDGKDAARSVERLFARDQARINYETKLQSVARSGFIYGLGVQKTYWQRKTKRVRETLPRRILPGYRVEDTTQVLYEGPQAEPVDIAHFFWDPAATSIETARWVIHRTYRDTDYVMDKIRNGTWLPVQEEAVKKGGSEEEASATMAERMAAGGMGTSSSTVNTGVKHEILEYHTASKVCTVLDNTFVVQEKDNPAYHGELPFQIFRPVQVPHEFAGIGEIEPIMHLQYELNTLRGQRRDAATVALNKPFIFQEDMVDEKDIVFAPNVGIPVLGNVNDVIKPIILDDIPQSGYREEQSIMENIDRTSGVSDPVMGGDEGGSAGSETATGIQLLQNAANVRIRQKTKNLERETIRSAARQWLALYSQHILKPTDIRYEDEGSEEGYGFDAVEPEDLLAIEDVEPEGGSTEPDNPPERQQRAMMLYQSLQANPAVEQRKALIHVLKEFDVKDPESWLAPEPPPPIDPEAMGLALSDVLKRLGLSSDEAEQATTFALEQGLEAAQQQSAPPSENGNQPQPQEAPA